MVTITLKNFFSEQAALIEAAISEAKEHASRVQAESNEPVKRY